ncbi:MAG: spermidine synthase [Planctomycetota bacterium]|jgi:spermidine synthase
MNSIPTRLTILIACCIFTSGAASLGLEVVWSRLLRLVFGSTTLAITTILVAYMAGLGIGGLIGGKLAGRFKNGIRAYGYMEIAVGIYAFGVPAILGLYPQLNQSMLAPLGFWPAAFVRFGLVLVLLLLPTFLMGATLPVLVATLVRERSDLGQRTALLYGVNTLGAVVGVLAVTFISFSRIGVQGTNTLAASLDIAVGLIAVFLIAPKLSSSTNPAETEQAAQAPTVSTGRRWSPALIAYGFVGFTALSYEVAWTRAFAMVLGSSTYAFATMLAGFLAGIALGALIIQRLLHRIEKPIAFFAGGLVLLGLSSLGVLFVFRFIPDAFLHVFADVGITGESLVWLGLIVSFVVMLAPTLVLGALFPLLVRIVGDDRGSGSAVGDVYFVNTIGSALGAFTAGFIAIPFLGLEGTMVSAITLNFVTAAAVLWFYRTQGSGAFKFASLATGLTAVAVFVFPPELNTEKLALGVYYRAKSQLDFGLEVIPMKGAVAARTLFYEEGINCTVSVHRTAGGIEEGGISMRINGKTDASLLDQSTQILSGHLPYLFGGQPGDAMVIGFASGVTTGAVCLYEQNSVDVIEIESAVVNASHAFDDYNHRPLEREEVNLVLDDGRTFLSYTDKQYDVIISEPSNPWISGCSNLFTSEFFVAVDAKLKPEGRLLQWVQLYGIDETGLKSILAALFESFDYAYGFLSNAGSTDLMLIATNQPIEFDQLVEWESLPLAVQKDLSRLGISSTADFWSLLFFDSEVLRKLALEATVVNTDDSMFVELDAPWHLYDDRLGSPAILDDLLLPLSSGIGPIIMGASDRPRDLLLEELAVAYTEQRHYPPLSRTVEKAFAPEAKPEFGLVLAAYNIFNSGGDPTEALALLNQAVKAAPEEFFPRYMRGTLSFEVEQYAMALPDLERALLLRPNHLPGQYSRMQCLTALGRMDEAAAFAKGLLNSPLRELEWGLVAESSFFAYRAGDKDLAIEQMLDYLELKPYSPKEWQIVSGWLADAGRVTEQREAAENAELAYRNQVRRYRWIALWHERFGNVSDALPALEEALRLDPENDAAQADLTRMQAGM